MKKIRFVWFAVCFAVALNGSALAYVDPSVMTYTIQVVAGVVVAVGAVVGIYWRRVRKKIRDKLGIQEKGKELEEEVIAYPDKKEP